MEIRRVKTKNAIWSLVNEYWETSSGWGHKTHIIRNGYDYGEYKVRYYNRTWEMYTYQSCMYGALAKVKEEELNRFIDNYKYENNIERFKKGQKEEIIKMFNETELGKDLKKIYRAIELRKFN